VGMAAAISILHKGLVRDLALMDVIIDKVDGERIDLQQGAALIAPISITSNKDPKDFAVTDNSDIIVIAAGARQLPGEDRPSLLARNVEMLSPIVSELVKHSPKAIFLVVSNPLDILTWLVWKLSKLPAHRVIGSGTTLDSSRFRFLLSEKLKVSPKSVHAYIIGEHGDSSVAMWSGVNVGGVVLRNLYPKLGWKEFKKPVEGEKEEEEDEWNKIASEVRKSAGIIIKKKGFTSWSIGMCISTLCAAILNDTEEVFPVSTTINGLHGFTSDVFVSLPAVLTSSGIREVVRQNFDKNELAALQNSVDEMKTIIDKAEAQLSQLKK